MSGMAVHRQITLRTPAGERVDVDELLAPFLIKLWAAGIHTWVSCQWDGGPDKVYPAYINGFDPARPTASWAWADEMAAALNLERWQWRQHNGVLWLHRSLVGECNRRIP